MATLRQIVYDIRGIIRDARSNDKHFPDRQIAFWIENLRIRLIKERLDSGQTIANKNYQTIPDVSMELVDVTTGVLGVDSGCQVNRTKDKLPEIFEYKGSPLISEIRGLNLFSKITILPKVQAIRIKNNKYTKHMPVGFIENEYLYLLGAGKSIENISVDALFYNPEEAMKMEDPDSDYFDSEYPLDDSFIQTMKEIIISRNLAFYLQVPEDKVNDAETAY